MVQYFLYNARHEDNKGILYCSPHVWHCTLVQYSTVLYINSPISCILIWRKIRLSEKLILD